jgi:hypothetical protein
MLIITGLGRCGTSFMMKFIKELGFPVGKDLHWIDEINAGYELRSAYSINLMAYSYYIKQGKEIDLDAKLDDKYWKDMSLREMIQNVDKDPRQLSVYAFKDPRFTWSPKLIEMWWSVRHDIEVLLLHRNVQEIIDSRGRLPQTYQEPKPERVNKPEVYKADFHDFLIKLLELQIPYQMLLYPNFTRDYDMTVRALNNLTYYFDSVKYKGNWDNIVQPR